MRPIRDTFMDAMYPGWQMQLYNMMLLAGSWTTAGVYHPGPKPDSQLTLIYDELYLAVTNAIPHKPSTISPQERV